MKIDGREIAQKILENLATKITPHLIVILIGDNPISKAYVRQKELKAKQIGVKTTVVNYESGITNRELTKTINQFNNSSNIHGIIVQRPLPAHLDNRTVSLAIDPRKDLDGFHPLSKFQPPLATAVLRILERLYRLQKARGGQMILSPALAASAIAGHEKSLADLSAFNKWLKSKKIVVIGKGETGGGPVIKRLKELGIKPQVIDSKTPNPELITKQADIIISAVGKSNVIKPNQIKRGVILIGIGIHKGEDGKLHSDYNEEQIKNKALFYTPTPGGVGPINVACLLENLVSAANVKVQD